MKSILFLLFALIVLCSAASSISAYPNVQELLPRFKVFWRVEQDMIYFSLNVQTTGWVGFGIAELNSGSMPGADIVIATVVEGTCIIRDSWSFDYVLPAKDDCQDWMLVSCSEENNTTIVEVKRKLDTGDAQDRVIISGPNRVIAAFGETDYLTYHNENRITSAITFFGSSEIPPMPANMQTMDLVMNNFWVPNNETVYGCMAFELPKDQKYHILQIDPVVQKENVLHVHHYLTNVCQKIPGGAIERYVQPGNCINDLATLGGCSGLFSGWAMGGGSMYTPTEAGLPMGVDGTQYVLLQIHYNNPASSGGYFDNSGLRIHYTNQLRTYDAGVLALGDPFVTWRYYQVIPANQITEFETECPESCTQRFPHEIYLFQSSPHMHELGREFVTTQWRDGEKIAEIGRIEYWSFEHQNINDINITVKPGDRLNTHCVFDSRGMSSPTTFGYASENEMCIHFLTYYPRIISPMVMEFCGPAGPRNTVCGNVSSSLYMSYPNPTVRDPPGILNRTFGIAEQTCAPETSTTTGDVTTGGAERLVLSLYVVVLVVLLWLL